MAHATTHAHDHSDMHADAAVVADDAGHQQHPLKVYFAIWGLLFVLSFFSYLVDFFAIQGFARWFLILLFMTLKAGLIMAIFMHMAWERLALTLAIVLPPLALMVFVGIMVSESDYTFFTREEFFGAWIPGEGELHEGAAHE